MKIQSKHEAAAVVWQTRISVFIGGRAAAGEYITHTYCLSPSKVSFATTATLFFTLYGYFAHGIFTLTAVIFNFFMN